MKVDKIDIQNFKGDFAKKHKDPPGLKVIPTPNAYMTDKVWNKLSPAFSKGLCDLLVIKDYPELWMFLNLDEYGYHMQGDALKIFADQNILIVKEEVDTSQVCQSYDKDVSLSEKWHHHHFLNGISMAVNVVYQYALIIVAKKGVYFMRVIIFVSCKLIY